jgi:hypothetical protein
MQGIRLIYAAVRFTALQRVLLFFVVSRPAAAAVVSTVAFSQVCIKRRIVLQRSSSLGGCFTGNQKLSPHYYSIRRPTSLVRSLLYDNFDSNNIDQDEFSGTSSSSVESSVLSKKLQSS